MRRPTAVLLIALAAVSYSACTPPECVPDEEGQFDLADCETAIGNLIELLTWLAYGQLPPEPERNTCPERPVCILPECIFAHENGSFEVADGDGPVLWYGDEADDTIIPVCDEDRALEFEATTPNGPSASPSSQVYQVIDYAAMIEGLSEPFSRVRAWAAFGIYLASESDDRQFGLRIDAYAGSGFPLAGDPEMIPTETGAYRRLATVEETLMYGVDGPRWQPVGAMLDVPEGTDFLVVFLEAVENVENGEGPGEFSAHAADYVHILLDRGNMPPTANPDQRRVPEGTPTSVYVTTNDQDNTSRLDETSVAIVQPPGSGSAAVQDNGSVLYTPDAGFTGTDTFTYTVADEEGLVSNEALVTLTVFASGYDLALTKTANPTFVTHSAPSTFTVTITNNGPASAAGVNVIDQVPDFPTTIQSTQTSKGNYNQGSGIWNIGILAAGETATLTITALIHVNVTNVATITGGLQKDTNADNNEDQASVSVGG